MTSSRLVRITGRAARARTRRSGAASPDAGFTLIELLVCLVLLATLSAIVLPRFLSERTPTLEERARAVAAELARFRAAAMGSGAMRIASSDALAQTLPEGLSLGETIPKELVFLPNGMSNGGVWKLAGDGRTVALRVDWLTGRVTIDAP